MSIPLKRDFPVLTLMYWAIIVVIPIGYNHMVATPVIVGVSQHRSGKQQGLNIDEYRIYRIYQQDVRPG